MSQNICFFVGNLNLAGGTERATTLIANGLATLDKNVFILNVYGGEQPFFPVNDAIYIHALFQQKVSMKKHALAAMWKIRQFVQQHQIQHFIVVDSISYVFAYPALLGLNIQQICWEHFSFDVDLGQRFRRFGRLLAAKYSDAVVTLTEHDRSQWQDNIASLQAKIVAIPNAVPFPIQATVPSQQHKTVLSIGRLRHEKGFDLLIQAWQQVHAQYPDWRLVIVGDGDEKSNLQQQVESLNLTNSIQLHAATADLSPYYAAASIYALSSRSEGFGLVLLEALAFGLPVVASRCIGPNEVLGSTENSLVEPDHVSQLAAALISTIALPLASYQQRVSDNKHHATQYLPEHILQQWLALFAVGKRS